MPEYSVGITKRGKPEIKFRLLDGETIKGNEKANSAAILASHDLGKIEAAYWPEEKLKLREDAVNVISGIIPKDQAELLIEATVEGREGSTLIFEKEGDIYKVRESNI